jgi:hypothetical protein
MLIIPEMGLLAFKYFIIVRLMYRKYIVIGLLMAVFAFPLHDSIVFADDKCWKIRKSYVNN